MSLNRKIY